MIANTVNTTLKQLHEFSRSKVALCIITKDENIDLYEWIDYHKSIGVNNVIIIEHSSRKPSTENIIDFIRSGYVSHYSYFSQQISGKNNQLYAYDFCLNNFKSEFSHIGFLDTDEFIVLKNKSETIIDLVDRYQDFGGLTLNWMYIGSNGHINRPPGGVLRNYNQCMRNHHVKSIVNTKYVHGVSSSPHSFKYVNDYYAVDTNYNRVDGHWNPANKSAPSLNLYNVAYINHYFLKSKEDFKRKHERGSSGNGGKRPLTLWTSKRFQFNETCDYLEVRKSVGTS